MVVPDEGTSMAQKYQIRQQIIFCATHSLVEYLRAQEPNEEGDFARVDYCGTNYASDSPLDRLVSFFQTKARREKGEIEFWYTRIHEMDRKGESKAVMVITTPFGEIDPLLFATTEMLAEGSVLAKAYNEVITPYRRQFGSVIEPFRGPEQEQSDIPGVVTVQVCGGYSPFNGYGSPNWLIGVIAFVDSLLPNVIESDKLEILKQDMARIKDASTNATPLLLGK
ncbi:hypothetical protein HY638_05130 [Candidatus Woesearchaeota archaeon]|nr:hypothetical protein [Candidatus Woesearchaeota archaeon]